MRGAKLVAAAKVEPVRTTRVVQRVQPARVTPLAVADARVAAPLSSQARNAADIASSLADEAQDRAKDRARDTEQGQDRD